MTDTSTINETDISSLLGHPYKVILFDDDIHDQFEVALQIKKAINCDSTRACAIMDEAQKNGRAIVFTGGLERCEHVESILAEIKLHTQIEPA